MEHVLDACLSKIELYHCLGGFCAKRGCETGVMEAKLTQQLVGSEEAPHIKIWLDLKRHLMSLTTRDDKFEFSANTGIS